MTQQELYRYRNRVAAYIDQRRLRDAITEIKDLAHRRMVWEIEDRLKQTEQNYAYMLQYLTEGVKDPDRDALYRSIVNDTYTLLDSLVSYIESADSPTLYYNNLRYNQLHPEKTRLADMMEQYRKLTDSLSLFSMVLSSPSEDQTKQRREAEKTQSSIFTKIWTTPQLSSDEMSVIQEAIKSPQLQAEAKQHLVSALTLGILQQYDRRKMQLLMDTYLNADNIKVSSAALVGMLFGLWRYSTRPLDHRLETMLMSIKDRPSWKSDLRIAYIEMIRARDTERINRKMREELMPKMDKLRPDMLEKIKNSEIDPEDPMSLQENPEWQELLDKSGVTDQLKELTEIQMEGGDVMMSTFAHLKDFAFFHDIANWFLPFDPAHTSVAGAMQQLDILGDMMENARFMCDSDKYSFMFAIGAVPESQRTLMVSQMKSQSDSIYEAMGHMNLDNSPESRRIAINSYMQNIYRFFKLYSRRNEFFDPFDQGINLISVPSLAKDFDDAELLEVVAEFYFKLKYMQDALDVYKRLDQLSKGDASRYQKIGYCYERLRDYPRAIEYYQRAELLDSRSRWVLKRLAICHRAIGEKGEALNYYRQLAQMQPDDAHAALMYGQSLMENEDYNEALHELYKVEFLDEKSTQAWRPLAWTLFMMGDKQGASDYYNKILMDHPSATDYLNMGHVQLSSGNIKDAVNHYVMAIKSHQGDREWFVEALRDDAPSLEKAGVDLSVLPLIADATAYRISQ